MAANRIRARLGQRVQVDRQRAGGRHAGELSGLCLGLRLTAIELLLSGTERSQAALQVADDATQAGGLRRLVERGDAQRGLGLGQGLLDAGAIGRQGPALFSEVGLAHVSRPIRTRCASLN